MPSVRLARPGFWSTPAVIPASSDGDVTVLSPEDRRSEVLRAEATGARQRFVFFWKERATPEAVLGRGCLSQFSRAPFVVDGITYATAEHWMMVEKGRLFDDRDAGDRALTTGIVTSVAILLASHER